MSNGNKCIYYKPFEKSRCTNQFLCPNKYKDGMKNMQCDVAGVLTCDKIKAREKPGIHIGW